MSPVGDDPISRWRQVPAALGGVALLALLAAVDFVPHSAEWFSAHPMTAAAVTTVVGFVAVTLFVERWLKDREATQLRRISTVAYRSLAQYANDAGRSLLAPLVGADLASLGVPSSWGESTAELRSRLERAGFASTFGENRGSWTSITPASHGHVLEHLLGDRHFVHGLFLCAAAERRRLHQATAVWSPVMLLSSAHADDLGELRDLTDALEMLQERVRAGLALSTAPAWSPEPGWVHEVSSDYWTTIAAYERLRTYLGDRAALPSDAIVHRHG
jgi:hypothetical protein